MNALKITKSSDVKILVDDEALCFVTDFSAKENRDAYEIEEILADECVDVVNNKKDYTIVITAYSMLDGSVFEKFDYTALGHIHSPQNVGNEKIRYCGTPLKYSFSEAMHKKSVTVAELNEKGSLTVREIQFKPLRDMRIIRG